MRTPTSPISLTPRQEEVLQEIVTTETIEYRYHQRARIILGFASGKNNTEVSKEVCLGREMVRKWCKRWLSCQEKLEVMEKEIDSQKFTKNILEILSDRHSIKSHPKTEADYKKIASINLFNTCLSNGNSPVTLFKKR